MSGGEKQSNLKRLVLVFLSITLWAALILARLVQLQVLEHEEYAQLAIQRQLVTRSVLAPRGVLYDSHMDELATSVPVNTVVAEPRKIRDVRAAAQSLGAILGMNGEELLNRMTDPARQTFMVVKRRINPQVESRIESLGIEGVYLVEESMRVYPNRELACHVLGFVNMNGDGGAGIELEYDKDLKGTQGLISFNVDARRRSFRGNVEKPPVQGHSLVLSIDRSIQYIAEKELKAGVEKFHATDGIAIVMESETGRILALADYPGFNCNAYNEYPPDRWRNRAVSDLFEPGSTFKVVVAAAALESGLTRPDEEIDCQMGFIVVGRHVFHDHKPYGLLTFKQVLEHSSNVGAIKLGLRMGEQRLYEALRTFGFGARTGVDLPGEIAGLVRDWRQWSALSIGAISFGQEVGVTSMQVLASINAIANGGYLVRPSAVDRIIDAEGNLTRMRAPERRRIMKEETASAVRDAFEGVVLRGTGRKAALEGYRAAGKTGTAQKIVDGRYSNTKYVASFVGFTPLPKPKLTILVQINEPKGVIYGSEVSAPVFRKIGQEALLQLRIPPDATLPLPKFDLALAAGNSKEDYLPKDTAIKPLAVDADLADEGEDIVVLVGGETVVLPDFRGMAKRQAAERCLELGIRMRPAGSGIAVYQVPPPGTRVPLGASCSVTFATSSVASRLDGPSEGALEQYGPGAGRTAGSRP